MGNKSSIDCLKGVLMLLVIVGHAGELTDRHNLALWMVAGFRMPLMIGISGYLLNVERTRKSNSRDMMSAYSRRLLLPWAVAMAVYITVSGLGLSWTTPIDLLLLPPFHLWYIPVLFFLIMVVRVLPLSPSQLIVMGAPASLATMYVFGLNHGPIGQEFLAIDNRFLRYPIYFFFGMLMAQRSFSFRRSAVALTAATLGMVWWGCLQGSNDNLAYLSSRLLMNLGLIALLPAVASASVHVAPLNSIGRESLFYYLWHPLAMAVLIATGMGVLPTLPLTIISLFVMCRLAKGSAFFQLVTGARRHTDRNSPIGKGMASAIA